MSSPSPEERAALSDDERREQAFLAKAARIIAVHRGLTPICRRQLTGIARGLGLTDEQMADALWSLQTGAKMAQGATPAVGSSHMSSTPKPPATKTKPAARQKPSPVSQATPSAKPPPLPPRTDSPEPELQPLDEASDHTTTGQSDTTYQAAPSAVPPPAASEPADAPVPATSAAEVETATSFEDTSVEPVARHEPPAPPAPPQAPEPPPPPAPPGPRPAEAFRAELRKAFAKVGKGGALSEKAEAKLARSGRNDFGLSEIYARHLVYDVAAECEVPVVSRIKVLRQHRATGGEARDAKIRDFLERITPIIAEQRGINVRSRVKMGAVARELGLSDDEVDLALKSLQKGADSPEESVERLAEREEACRKSLRRRLAKRSGTMLTFAKEREYVEMGYDRFGVSHAFVREAIRSLTSELGVIYVSEKQAREHVARLVDEKIGDSQRVVQHERQLLHREGAQWGLSPDEVDAVIREKHIEVDFAARSKQTRYVAVLAISAVLVIGAAGGLGALALFHPFSKQKPDEEEVTQNTDPEGDPDKVAPPPTPPETVNLGPEWCDGDLASYISRARSSSPNCAAVLANLSSSDAGVRGEAYEELVRMAPDPLPDQLSDADARDIPRIGYFEGVLIGCYALDPSDEAAGRLRGALLRLVPPPHSDLPEDSLVFRRACWAAETALKSLRHRSISDERAGDLVHDISRAVDTTIEASDAPEQMERSAFEALCSHLYRLLVMAAPTQPNLALALHATLPAKAIRSLDAAVREGLDTDLVVAALPTVGDTWRNWEGLIERCLLSRDKLNVIKILDVYERLDNGALQEYLGDVLLARVGLRTDEPDVELVVRVVREKLGFPASVGPRTAGDRWSAFRDRANEALAGLKATPDTPQALLTEVIRLQHASTLGCALAQQELGAPTFAEITEREPEKLGRVGGDDDDDTPRRPPADDRFEEDRRTMTKTLQSQLSRAITPLRNFRTSNARTRVSTVEWLVGWTTKIPEIDPNLGDDIAEYLLTAKIVEEHENIVPHVKELCRWRTVRLGLADRFQESRLRPEHRDEILTAALGRDVKTGDDKIEQEKIRRDLLVSVANELSGSARAADGAASLYDRAANLLHDYYTIQARLCGVLPAQYTVTETPSAVLELAINHYATELSGRVKRPADRQFVDALPQHLAAAKYVGTDDVQQTLLLERIWLRLLAAGVALEHADRADDADQLVAELGGRDAKATHVLNQLRDGHETILRMWLLRCKPK